MIYKLIGVTILVALIGAASTYWFACPCDRIPGGPLAGDEIKQIVADWSFVNDPAAVPLCQIEVDFLLSRSMNVNCMSSDGLLFVSCSNCEGKQWSTRALTHPEGRVRAAGKVYDIRYRRVTDVGELDRAWNSRSSKFGREPTARPKGWWSFNLVSR